MPRSVASLIEQFVNSGAHWNAAILKLRDQPTTERVYAMMVRRVRRADLTRQVDRAVPQLLARPGLDVIVRGMSIPHYSCWTADAPIAQAVVPGELANAPDASNPVESGYGWTSFARYDRLWADALARSYDPHPRSTRLFLNLTTLSGQRPDAHLLGATMTDCLHVRCSPCRARLSAQWCAPTIPAQILRMLRYIVV